MDCKLFFVLTLASALLNSNVIKKRKVYLGYTENFSRCMGEGRRLNIDRTVVFFDKS